MSPDTLSKKRHNAQKRDFLKAYKLSKGCEICGFSGHHSALTFDHIDPSTKVYNLADYKMYGWEVLLKEVLKCRVICANCHNEHTYNTYGNDITATPISERTKKLMADILGLGHFDL